MNDRIKGGESMGILCICGDISIIAIHFVRRKEVKKLIVPDSLSPRQHLFLQHEMRPQIIMMRSKHNDTARKTES